jgi:2,3-bisphosphoglycerate-independent phosphoglycerate mutase
VWVWGHGRRLDLPSINERFHVEGAVIAAVALPRGVGRAAGLRVVEVPGISGGLDSNFRGKVEYGLRSLGERAFLLLHVGAADEDGHGGDLHRKVEAIERIDAEVIGPLLGGLTASGDDWRMLVMPDRFTATGRRLQTDDPVPFAVSVARDAGKSRGAARAFTEKDARDAGIFIPEAHTLMERLLRR